MRYIAITLGLLGCTGPFLQPVMAQQVEIGFQGGRVTDQHGREYNALVAAPSLSWRGSEGAARLQARGALLNGGAWLGSVAGSTRLHLGEWGPLGLTLNGGGGVNVSTTGYRSVEGRLSPRLHLSSIRSGVEVGPYLSGGGQSFRRSVAGPGLFSGSDTRWSETEWRTVRGMEVEAWTGHGPVTVHAGWSNANSEQSTWQDLSATAQLSLGPLTLGGTYGRRLATEEEQWASGSVQLRLSDATALRVDAGSYPSDPLTRRAAGRFATVGLQLTPGRTPSRPRPFPVTSDGRVRLTLRAEPDAQVEVAGDWTEWEPQPVPMVREGVYTVAVKLPPGTHRFLFRVNGEWRVPEGYPTEPDGYGGRNAVLRIY